jgi:hypothetical protein
MRAGERVRAKVVLALVAFALVVAAALFVRQGGRERDRVEAVPSASSVDIPPNGVELTAASALPVAPTADAGDKPIAPVEIEER